MKIKPINDPKLAGMKGMTFFKLFIEKIAVVSAMGRACQNICSRLTGSLRAFRLQQIEQG